MNKALFFVFMVLFASFSWAQAAVIIEPLEGEGILSLYPYEVKEYRLTVVNISDEDLENFEVVLSVSPEIAVVVNGEDRSEAYYSFLSFPAGAREERRFRIKGLEVTSRNAEIRADYGFGALNNSASTGVKVEASDFSFSSRLSQTSLSPGQQGSVLFDFSNNSPEKITGIRALLFSDDTVEIESPAFELDSLDPRQGISNTEFLFSLGEGTGERILGMRLFFDDTKGSHVLEKSFSLDVQHRDVYVLALVLAIMCLVALSFYMRRNRATQKVDTQGIEVKTIDKKGSSKPVKTEKIKNPEIEESK